MSERAASLASALTRCRGTNPRQLARTLRGDLDNIVGRALKRNPVERYSTVDALAEDLRRYLKREPVRARPDSFVYRASKFASRNRMLASIVTLALSVWAVAILAVMIEASRANQNAARAELERGRADRQARVATSAGRIVAAEARFNRGILLLREHKYAQACEQLALSQQLDPSIGTTMYLAECYEKLGVSVSAWLLFRLAASASRAAGQYERFEASTLRAERLEARLPRPAMDVATTLSGYGPAVILNGFDWPVSPSVSTSACSVRDRSATFGVDRR